MTTITDAELKELRQFAATHPPLNTKKQTTKLITAYEELKAQKPKQKRWIKAMSPTDKTWYIIDTELKRFVCFGSRLWLSLLESEADAKIAELEAEEKDEFGVFGEKIKRKADEWTPNPHEICELLNERRK